MWMHVILRNYGWILVLTFNNILSWKDKLSILQKAQTLFWVSSLLPQQETTKQKDVILNINVITDYDSSSPTKPEIYFNL